MLDRQQREFVVLTGLVLVRVGVCATGTRFVREQKHMHGKVAKFVYPVPVLTRTRVI